MVFPPQNLLWITLMFLNWSAKVRNRLPLFFVNYLGFRNPCSTERLFYRSHKAYLAQTSSDSLYIPSHSFLFPARLRAEVFFFLLPGNTFHGASYFPMFILGKYILFAFLQNMIKQWKQAVFIFSCLSFPLSFFY